MEEWKEALAKEVEMYIKLTKLSEKVVEILNEQIEERKDLETKQIECLEKMTFMLEFVLKGKEIVRSKDSLSPD